MNLSRPEANTGYTSYSLAVTIDNTSLLPPKPKTICFFFIDGRNQIEKSRSIRKSKLYKLRQKKKVAQTYKNLSTKLRKLKNLYTFYKIITRLICTYSAQLKADHRGKYLLQSYKKNHS